LVKFLEKMNLFVGVINIFAAILILFSNEFGFNLEKVGCTFAYLYIFWFFSFLIYKYYVGIWISRKWFYPVTAVILTFCLHPALDFYAVNTESFAINQLGENVEVEIVKFAWYGTLYTKFVLAVGALLIGVMIYFKFDKK